MLHDVLYDFFEQRLIFPEDLRPREVLDCGCGKGFWADAVEEEYGCDVSPTEVWIAARKRGNVALQPA